MGNDISRNEFLKSLAIGGMGIGAGFNNSFFNAPTSTSPDIQNDNQFKVRGFHVDMRIEVMTMPALKNLARNLSSMGINMLILEYTASYPYQKHATLLGNNAYSREEIKDLVSFCKRLGIQVVPLLENLGHVQYILKHERYANLRIERDILSQVDPLNENAILLFKDLIEDLISLHPSKYIHLGGDEARHLHNKKFAEYIKKYGVSKLYTQYMRQICQIAIDHGKVPLLWADMILKYPETIENLQIDHIKFINWIYHGARANTFGNVKALQEKGCTFWGAPALRSSPDNYFITRWQYHFNNIKEFIPYSRGAGYKGMVMTSWSTSGVYDSRWQGTSLTVLKMFPIRNVYPLSGFHILIAAFGYALKTKESINPKHFVINYAQHRFGMSKAEGEVLWNYLAQKQEIVGGWRTFNEKKVVGIYKNFRKVSKPIHQLNPAHHTHEFEQFKMMADIRVFYLAVRRIEAIVESEGFSLSQTHNVKAKLKPLVETSKKLGHRFKALNKGYLHESELQRLNQVMNIRLNKLLNIYED